MVGQYVIREIAASLSLCNSESEVEVIVKDASQSNEKGCGIFLISTSL